MLCFFNHMQVFFNIFLWFLSDSFILSWKKEIFSFLLEITQPYYSHTYLFFVLTLNFIIRCISVIYFLKLGGSAPNEYTSQPLCRSHRLSNCANLPFFKKVIGLRKIERHYHDHWRFSFIVFIVAHTRTHYTCPNSATLIMKYFMQHI